MKKIYLLSTLFLIGCSASKNEELGAINISSQEQSQAITTNFNKNDVMYTPDEAKSIVEALYQQNEFKSTFISTNLDLTKLTSNDITEGKFYILSNSDATRFQEKKIKYIKNDINGFLNSYHQFVSSDPNMLLGTRLDEQGNLLVNFNGFSPTSYLFNNQSFRDRYLDSRPGVSDVRFMPDTELKVLEGYYRTVKANFPQVKLVYFQLGGNPWELIKGEIHDGLLFMEPGQNKPEKAPLYLYKSTTDSYNKDTGFSNNYTGNRFIDQPNNSIIDNYSPVIPSDETPINNNNNQTSSVINSRKNLFSESQQTIDKVLNGQNNTQDVSKEQKGEIIDIPNLKTIKPNN